MANHSNITLSNRLIVPAHLVTEDDLRQFYYEWKENKYSLKEDEFGEVVLNEFEKPIRERTKVIYSLRSYREIFGKGGENYISFPRGNRQKIGRFLHMRHRDLRPIIPLGVKLQINNSTKEDHRWSDQKRCIDEYMQYGHGIIEGDTGSGKTIVGIGVLCELGMTTLILSPQTDGTDQWIEEIRAHTNINEYEKQAGRKLIGAYQARRKRTVFPITVGTVQSFLRDNGKYWLLEHRSDFGTLILDEVQDFGAEQFSKIPQAVNSFAILGLTATTKRSDQRHYLLFDIVGPVVAKGTAKQMPPTVYFIETGVQCPTWQYTKNYPPHYQWKVILDHLVKDEDRYKVIQKYLRKDVDDGRFVACVSAERTEVVKKLRLMLSQDGYEVRYVDGDTPKKVRKIIYDEVRNKKVQILFAGKVLNQLVNLPTIDCLHYVTPVSSRKNTKQAYGRARRWLVGKRNPIIRDYVDEGGGQLEGAYKNRVELCRANGWSVKLVSSTMSRMSGLTVWKPRGKRTKK